MNRSLAVCCSAGICSTSVFTGLLHVRHEFFFASEWSHFLRQSPTYMYPM